MELTGADDERRGVEISWSPDSTRILVQRSGGPRALFDADGELVRRFDLAESVRGDPEVIWRESTHAVLLRQPLGVAAIDWRTGEMSKVDGQAAFYSVGETPESYGISPDGKVVVVSSAPMVMTKTHTTTC